MNRFAIGRPKSFEQAKSLLEDDRFALPVIKAGGMDLLDQMKEGLLEPDLLIDVLPIPTGADEHGIALEQDGEGRSVVRIAATTTLAQIARSRVLASHLPALAQAARSAATPQVRNVATVAGNLLQRPRCWYFRGAEFDCLKKGGHQCFAVEGENRFHAVFSEGPCYIVHPSNLAPALHVGGADVHLVGGERKSLAVQRLFHTPDRALRSEHELEENEVLTHITVGAAPLSGFASIKEKQSFDWPLVMAAAALEMDGDRIRSARVCAGAVAPVPWPLPRVERALRGVSVDDEIALAEACAVAAEGAKPLSDNAYKLRLLPVVVHRAIRRAAGRNEEA